MTGFSVDKPRQILAAACSGGTGWSPSALHGNRAEWLGWRKNITITAAINGWDNHRQRQEIVLVMTRAARQYVADFPVGYCMLPGLAPGAAVPDSQDVTLLLSLYEQHFLLAAASNIARVNFRQASEREDEAIITGRPVCASCPCLPQHACRRPGDQH